MALKKEEWERLRGLGGKKKMELKDVTMETDDRTKREYRATQSMDTVRLSFAIHQSANQKIHSYDISHQSVISHQMYKYSKIKL